MDGQKPPIPSNLLKEEKSKAGSTFSVLHKHLTLHNFISRFPVYHSFTGKLLSTMRTL